MTAASIYRTKSRKNWWPIAIGIVFLLLVLAILAFIFWIVGLDNRGTFHNSAESADLDGDGDVDVILHNVRNESETVAFSGTTLWMNEGGGRFSPSTINLAPHLYLDASPTDVDSDGDADLLLLASHQLMIFENQGETQDGETTPFKHGKSILPPAKELTMGSIALGDLNGDGRSDSFVAGCCGMSVSWASGEESYLPSMSWVWNIVENPNGWLFSRVLRQDELDDIPIRDAAIGDLNGDGNNDVFAAVQLHKSINSSPASDLILINDGSGHLSDSGQRLGDYDSSSVALGDVDGDGDLDTLVGAQEGAVLWINQGGAQQGTEGIFINSFLTTVDDQVSDVFLADLDRDGDLDALVAGLERATIWLNDGTGTFSKTGQQFRYTQRHGLTIDDFDGDGWPDIFAASYGKSYKVWTNQRDGVFQRAS